ncbi:MAG: ROK family transcriptional regulator [Acidimicrobiales bacterium]
MRGRRESVLGLRTPVKAVREDTRATNMRLVLQHLFDADALSRADIARATRLTAATVSAIVSELEQDGLVARAGTRRDVAQVGKPPTMLEIRPEARNVVALDLSDPDTLQAAVLDLRGSIVARAEVAIAERGQDAVERVKGLTATMIEQTDSPVLGIGVGTPGVVSTDGVVVEASNFGWHDVDLRQELENHTGCRVHVRNDANVAAIAEFTRGGHDCENLAVVKIGSGVGAGFVLNGRPFSGEHAGAGEIGHLVVDVDGPPCRCGHRGCIETFVAVPAIEAAQADDPENTVSVRRAAGEKLGVALASIVAILDIDHIMVSGPEHILGPEFCETATASLRTRCLDSVAESVAVQYTSLGHDIVLLGAAGLVLSQELGVV